MHLSFDPTKSFRVTEYSDCALPPRIERSSVILKAAHHVFK